MSEGDRIKKFLKQDKVEIKPVDTKEFIRRKLTEEPKVYSQYKVNFRQAWTHWARMIPNKLIRFRKGHLKYFLRDSFPVLVFTVFSTYVLWKMQDDYDNICRQYKKDLSYKQEIIDKEDEDIRAFLERNPADPNVPIRDNFKRTTKYRFEDMDSDIEEQNSFDTKSDMLDNLMQEKHVPKEYQADLNEYMVVKNNSTVVDDSQILKSKSYKTQQ